MSYVREKIMDNQKRFGSNLSNIRVKKNMTQLDLATKCNLEKTTISRIENGRTNITLKTATNISIGLGVNLQELFYF